MYALFIHASILCSLLRISLNKDWFFDTSNLKNKNNIVSQVIIVVIILIIIINNIPRTWKTIFNTYFGMAWLSQN